MRNETDILFSLVIPTRNRIRLLNNCLHSFFGRASNINNVEAVLLADVDDYSMREFGEFVLNNEYNIRVIFQHRSEKIIKDCNNYGAQCTTGKYVWIINDDTEMTTPNWDEIIYNRCETFLADKRDRIIYVQVDDSTYQNEEMGCCFPILSREAIDIQNGIMPSEIDMWGADISLYNTFRSLPQNRILNIMSEIKVLHHCRHNGTMIPDEIAHRVSNISKKAKLTNQEIENYVKMFSNKLK